MSSTHPLCTARPATDSGTHLVVLAKETVATDAVALTLSDPAGGRLPDWTPGAHLDLHLGQGRIRQYSLCGSRWDASTYRVGVKLDRHGRGGSSYVHDELQVGDIVGFGGPRNTFRMHPADSYLFVGAGIGITPLLPMIDQAERLGTPWRCVALARTRAAMPFLSDLERYGEKVQFIESSVVGRCDLRQIIGEQDGTTGVYACGPERFLEALEEIAPDLDLPPSGLCMERFTAAADPVSRDDTSFELELARSGRVLKVGPHQTVLNALRAEGLNVLASCEQGLCGTCETDVLAGIPDHRDSALTPYERSANDCFMACVSRSHTPRLTVDL